MVRLPKVLILLFVFLYLANPLAAVENPQTGAAKVTATIPESREPDTPVLIAPGNNSTIATTTPSFIFSPSLGSVVVSHYQLWIDGVLNRDHIPASLQTITTQASSPLSEGTHTWMIKAIGNNGKTRDSTTWTFTIDTTAPLILVTQVAGQDTNLSSLDLTPWQKEIVFTTNDRYPLINGQSEAGATLTINFGDHSVTTQVGSDRLFSLRPSIALAVGRYTISVTSSDQAGNTTTLPSFYLDIVAAATPITISLPSPLPDLSFTIPISVPETLFPVTAFPIIPTGPETVNYAIWLIIVTYLCHIYCLNKLIHRLYLHHTIKSYHLILIYITIILPTLLLSYIFIVIHHWLTLVLSLLSLFTAVYEIKLIRSKDIKIEQD